MSSPAGLPKGPQWPLILALADPPILFSALQTVTLAGPRSTETDREFAPTTTDPAARRQRVQSKSSATNGTTSARNCLEAHPNARAIASDVNRIIAFSQRNPLGPCPIDVESPTASSFLTSPDRRSRATGSES
jgi:hypothetical protein